MNFSEWLETPAGSFGADLGSGLLNNLVGWLRDSSSRSWQEEMWNKQNEYNLPINQRKRLEEAGINPNLAFGSAASAMGTSLPSSPGVHMSDIRMENFWRRKQLDLQEKEINSQVDRQNEETRRLDLMNTMTELLFNDRLQTERGSLTIDRIIQGWNEDHWRELADIGLSRQEFLRDLEEAQVLSTRARTSEVLQRIDHLRIKYKFEDSYYSKNQNPYETSTAIGFMRTLLGLISDGLEIKPFSVFNLPYSYDSEKANDKNRDW